MLLLLDTKWFLPRSPQVNEELGCSASSPSAALAGIDDVLKDNPQKHVIVAAHIAQNMKPYEYRYMHKSFAEIYRQHGGLVHAEDNNPALSYAWQDSINYLRTGLNAPNAKLPKKFRAVFSRNRTGFAKLIFYKNGAAYLEFYTDAAHASTVKPAFRRLLIQKTTLAQLNARIKPMPAPEFYFRK